MQDEPNTQPSAPSAGGPTDQPSVPSVTPQPMAGAVSPVSTSAPSAADVNPPASMSTSSMSDAPRVMTSTQPVVTSGSSRPAWMKKPPMVAAIGVAAAVLIGGGFVFGFYLPNTPDWIYSASLSNTAKGMDVLLDYSKSQDAAHYKGVAYDGSLALKSPGGSMDASLTGASDGSGNANFALTADVMGQKGNANIRSIHVNGTDSPDLYVQVGGIKSVLDAAGMESLDSLDGQWIAIDHTLLDTYAAQLKASDGISTNTKTSTELPTYAQFDDAARRVQQVNKDYLFTTGNKAVLQKQKFIATETVNSRPMNHYVVGYDKTHFVAYVDALNAAVDGSKLNDWSKKANGKDLSKVLDLNSMKTDVQNAKSDYTFDLWTDNQTKLVSKVAFKDPADSSSAFSVSQGYTGGSAYPVTLAMTGKDDTGGQQDGSMGLTVDTKTNKVTFTFGLTTKGSDGTTTVDVTVHGTPSNNAVKVTAPAGAKSLNDILTSIGLGGLMDTTPNSGLTTNPFGTLGSQT